jgi:hypothetical protein
VASAQVRYQVVRRTDTTSAFLLTIELRCTAAVVTAEERIRLLADGEVAHDDGGRTEVAAS